MSGYFAKTWLRALVAVDLALHAEQPAHRYYVALRRAVFFGQVVHDELARHAADRHVVAVYVGGEIGLQDVALQADHRDLCIHRLPHHRGQRGALVGRDNQQVRLLADEGLHLRHLLAVVLLRVADHQFHVRLLREQAGHHLVLRGAIGLGVIRLAERHKELLPGRVGGRRASCEQK